MPNQLVCKCNGTGALKYEHTRRNDRGDMISRTAGSRLCPCRQDLEPREGEARWWDLLVVERHDFGDATTMLTATIEVETEVPISEDNFKVVSRGNRYYPTMVRLTADGPGGDFSVSLLADDVRQFSRLLNLAAAACERIDAEDSASCGHWAPCDCGDASREEHP